MLKEYRFKLTLTHIYHKDKFIQHYIYAETNSAANLKAQLMIKRIRERNPRMQLFDLKEVVFDPEEKTYA